jgi:hypothetical protein
MLFVNPFVKIANGFPLQLLTLPCLVIKLSLHPINYPGIFHGTKPADFSNRQPFAMETREVDQPCIVMIGIFFLAVLVLAVIRGYNPSLPNLEARARAYEKKLDPANPLTVNHHPK